MGTWIADPVQDPGCERRQLPAHVLYDSESNPYAWIPGLAKHSALWLRFGEEGGPRGGQNVMLNSITAGEGADACHDARYRRGFQYRSPRGPNEDFNTEFRNQSGAELDVAGGASGEDHDSFKLSSC